MRIKGATGWQRGVMVSTLLLLEWLLTGKPSQYVTGQLGQLSLPSLQGRQIEYQPICLGEAHSLVSGGR